MELKLFDGLTQLYCYYSANFQNVIFSKSKLLSQFYCSSLFSFFLLFWVIETFLIHLYHLQLTVYVIMQVRVYLINCQI